MSPSGTHFSTIGTAASKVWIHRRMDRHKRAGQPEITILLTDPGALCQSRCLGRRNEPANVLQSLALCVCGIRSTSTDPSGHDPWWCDYLYNDEPDIIRCRLGYVQALMDILGRANDTSGTAAPPPRCTPTHPPATIANTNASNHLSAAARGALGGVFPAYLFRLSAYYRPQAGPMVGLSREDHGKRGWEAAQAVDLLFPLLQVLRALQSRDPAPRIIW